MPIAITREVSRSLGAYHLDKLASVEKENTLMNAFSSAMTYYPTVCGRRKSLLCFASATEKAFTGV